MSNIDDETCPICYESYSIIEYKLKDGNQNHEIENTNCMHWFCIDCLKEFNKRAIYICPLCRDCIRELVSTYESDDE